jgi:hypothetical protein
MPTHRKVDGMKRDAQAAAAIDDLAKTVDPTRIIEQLDGLLEDVQRRFATKLEGGEIDRLQPATFVRMWRDLTVIRLGLARLTSTGSPPALETIEEFLERVEREGDTAP